ncbi:hypothetical protein ACFXTI_032103 [Malus domestica]
MSASTPKLHLQSFNSKASPIKASPTKASSMKDNYKFSKASHYLDQDNVKQNQIMVPNKSFNSEASPTKLQLRSFTYKSFTHNSFTYKSFTHKSFYTKVSAQKLHQQKLHQWRTTTNSQKLHTILIKIV